MPPARQTLLNTAPFIEDIIFVALSAEALSA